MEANEKGQARDQVLVNALEQVCARAKEVVQGARGAPMAKGRCVRREQNGRLAEAALEEVDWRALRIEVSRGRDFWKEMAGLTERLRGDGEVEVVVGFEDSAEGRAAPLWDSVIGSIFEHYGRERPELGWDAGLAATLVGEWRADARAHSEAMQTIAPLHNCRCLDEAVEIEPGLAIRRLSDEDRDALWQSFGAEHFPGPINPSIADLEAWKCAVEIRWQKSRRPPLSDVPAYEAVRDAVRALRLHHPGVTGTTVIWTRPDPVQARWARDGAALYAPLGSGPGLYLDKLEAQVGAGDGEALRGGLRGLRRAAGDHRLELALRRFDASFARHELEDRLIDLWVAFEALLLPDVRNELSYRAAVRIALLVGTSPADRRAAFEAARASYRARSAIVHGEHAKEIDRTVRDTRELARRALRRWLLDPPQKGVDSLDTELFG